MRGFGRLLTATVIALGLLGGVAVAPAGAAPRPAAAGWGADCVYAAGDAEYTTQRGVGAWRIVGAVFRNGQYCQVGKAKLYFQYDGNLVVYDENNVARWAASWSRPGVIHQAVWTQMQGFDGNFVMYNVNDVPLWASNTCCTLANTLEVQDDGNVVIYRGNTPVWKTNTAH